MKHVLSIASIGQTLSKRRADIQQQQASSKHLAGSLANI